MRMDNNAIGLAIGLAVGFGLFALGCFFWIKHIRFFKRAIMLWGKVVDYESYEDSEGTTMYHAVVGYEFDGENRTVVDNSVSSSWKPKIGKIRQVGVDPLNPQDARIYSKIPIGPVISVGLGLLLLFLGLPSLIQRFT